MSPVAFTLLWRLKFLATGPTVCRPVTHLQRIIYFLYSISFSSMWINIISFCQIQTGDFAVSVCVMCQLLAAQCGPCEICTSARDLDVALSRGPDTLIKLRCLIKKYWSGQNLICIHYGGGVFLALSFPEMFGCSAAALGELMANCLGWGHNVDYCSRRLMLLSLSAL